MSLFDDYISLERSITDSLLQCCSHHEDEVNVVLTFGRLVGADNDQPIYLPAASDCLLERSSDYKFVEEVPDSTAGILETRIFHSARDAWKVKVDHLASVIEYHFKNDTIVAVQALSDEENTEEKKAEKINERGAAENWGTGSEIKHEFGIQCPSLQYVRVVRLGELHIYRSQSDLHMRISFVVRKGIPPPAAATVTSENPSNKSTDQTAHRRPEREFEITRAVRRQLRNWWMAPDGGCGVEWRIIMGSNYELSPPATIAEATKDWLVDAEDGVEPVSTLRLSTNPEFIAEHYQLYNEGRRHGLVRFVRELIENGRALANLIDVGTEGHAYYYPAHFGDIAAQSRKHYNLKQAKGLAAAHESKIEALRRLNNEVKRCLIEEHVPHGAAILDLACGHGQDINKYSTKTISRFVGIDISSQEIREAGKRLKESRFLVDCPWKFFVGNLLQEQAYEPIKDEVFDVVSLQLAIHYCIASEKQAEDLFQRITKHLIPGGYFIGSTGDCHTIAERIAAGVHVNYPPPEEIEKTPPSFWFGNSVYSVTFASIAMDRIRGELDVPDTVTSDFIECEDLEGMDHRLSTEWGIKYTFWLIEHINADEYVVPWKAFCAVAAKYGLQLIASERFDQFFARQLATNRRLQMWKEKQLEKIPFDAAQAEAFSFYKVFAFKKLTHSTPLPSALPPLSSAGTISPPHLLHPQTSPSQGLTTATRMPLQPFVQPSIRAPLQQASPTVTRRPLSTASVRPPIATPQLIPGAAVASTLNSSYAIPAPTLVPNSLCPIVPTVPTPLLDSESDSESSDSSDSSSSSSTSSSGSSSNSENAPTPIGLIENQLASASHNQR